MMSAIRSVSWWKRWLSGCIVRCDNRVWVRVSPTQMSLECPQCGDTQPVLPSDTTN